MKITTFALLGGLALASTQAFAFHCPMDMKKIDEAMGKNPKLSADQMADALLFRVIATTATDVPVGAVDDWLWQGPTPALAEVAARLGAPDLADRAQRVWQRAAARAAGNDNSR